MLERLVVRAELSAFERSLRDRVDRIAALDDERLARPRSIERGPDGSLVVLSEFVPGSRLSDLLDSASQQGADLPGVDVALGFLIDLLPALCGLHAGAGFAHGALGPGRTMLTPAGQVVLLDGIFGDALSRLGYSRTRLWNEFAIAMPPAAGPARFDASADIAQAALCAVMLVLGRPLAHDEYPDAVPSLLVEVVDVAQIRGSSDFATGLQRFLQRALPIPGRRPYTAADDALIDVRDLAREIGVDVCRRALVEFIEHQESGGQPAGDHAARESLGYDFEYATEETYSANGDGDDEDESSLEMDLNLDEHAEPEEAAVYDLVAGSEDEEPAAEETPAIETTAYDDFASSTPAEPEPAPFAADSFADALRDAEPVAERAWDERPAAPADEPYVSPSASGDPIAAPPAEDAPIEAAAPDVADAAPEFEEAASAAEETETQDEETDTPTESVEEAQESRSSRRRKRSRSARSKKDKLRSAERPQPLAPKPLAPPPPTPPPPPRPAPVPVAAAPPPPVSKPTQSGWLVEPNRAASFDPPVPAFRTPAEPPPFAPPPPPAPPPIALAPPPPPAAPPAPAPVPEPIVLAPPMPRPISVAPPAPPPIPVLRPPAAPAPPAPSTVKLKVDAAPRKPRPDPADDIYAPRHMAPPESAPKEFPWKIASGALVVLVVGLVAGRAYLTGGSGDKPSRPTSAETAPPPVTAPTPAPASPRMGRVQIETQPPGARVLLDGKHVGESPVSLDVPAGRHTLTLAAASGSVRRTIKVEAGKTLTIDVPIFSGWVDVVAPIVLDVTENGKTIGTTEQNRLLLSPGRHELTFSNRDLDYSSTHTVDVEPGEAKTLTLDPRGTANLNASPWAEVWIDGKKVGETPLANLQVPLGTHEVVFKHPQFGERRMTTTIRAHAPIALSIDMSKPQ